LAIAITANPKSPRRIYKDKGKEQPTEVIPMSDNPTGYVKDKPDLWFDDMDMRPGIEVWPADDDFGQWVAAHENPAMAGLCSTPQFKDTPFCGLGYH
jgi:hypothetical protein